MTANAGCDVDAASDGCDVWDVFSFVIGGAL